MVDGVVSVEDMLSRSAANVKSGKTTANMSEVQKLLAARDTPIEDTVELSPVRQILERQKQDADEVENYFESDEYLQLKVQQLQAQLATYSAVPGLDPSGAILDSIEAEIKDIISTQQEKLQKTLDTAEEKEAELAEIEAQRAAELTSAEDMLAKVRGENSGTTISDEAQKLLDNLGSNVDTTA